MCSCTSSNEKGVISVRVKPVLQLLIAILVSNVVTAKKRVESILDFQLICHLYSGTYC